MAISRIALVVGLLLVFLLVLIASAPARLLHQVVPGEQILLEGVGGTVWQGSASRCLIKLPQGYLHLGAVQWSLAPASLLSLAPRISLNSAWGSQRMQATLTLRGAQDLDIEGLELQADAALVQQFAPLAVDGVVSMQMERLTLREGLPYSADGRLVWQNGGFKSPQGRIALGTYALQIVQPAGEALQADVLTLSGELQAEGRATLEGRRYAVDVLLSSDRDYQPQLKQALDLMAVPEGNNYRIVLDAEF